MFIPLRYFKISGSKFTLRIKIQIYINLSHIRKCAGSPDLVEKGYSPVDTHCECVSWPLLGSVHTFHQAE